MSAVTSIHVCRYVLWSGNRWICKSACHYNQVLNLPAPGRKPGRWVA